jgi:large subunit ribosomal protein L3
VSFKLAHFFALLKIKSIKNYMITSLVGIKKGMTQTYDARGRRVGATIVSVEPNFISHIKTVDGKDGYQSVQLASRHNRKSINKPQIGHLKKAGIEGARFLKEIKVENVEDLKAGQEVSLSQVFQKGDSVKVTGTSKGKGFQGGVKRHGFAGGPKTHGQSDRHRAPGSIGAGTTPGRVYKGHNMAGHMGVETVSYKGLEVVGVDRKENLLIIKGGVPGSIGAFITIEKQGRIKGYTPPPEEKEDEDEEEGEKAQDQGENVEQQPESAAVEDTTTEGEENAN